MPNMLDYWCISWILSKWLTFFLLCLYFYILILTSHKILVRNKNIKKSSNHIWVFKGFQSNSKTELLSLTCWLNDFQKYQIQDWDQIIITWSRYQWDIFFFFWLSGINGIVCEGGDVTFGFLCKLKSL